MTLLLNILWFIFGGFAAGLAWLLAACVLAITLIGLPWAGAALRIASFSFAPFGRTVVPREYVTGRHDAGTGEMGFVLNVIWFLLAGWWLALGHLAIAIAQGVTIIGIPFAIQHFKLAIIALAPVGREVVPV